MKLAVIFEPFCCPRGFDHSNIWTAQRGMSGSDLGGYRMAQEAQRLGHDVTLYTFPDAGTTLPDTWEGLRIRHYDQRLEEGWDAAVAWNHPDALHGVKARLRACSCQINTVLGRPGDVVDVWFSPSQWHKNRLQNHHPAPWEVVPDGCDLEPFDALFAAGFQKVPGRVVWTSSPDRGLHWLLQEWPMIKRAVPHANLRVFYKLKPWLDHFRAKPALMEDSIQEQHQRALYIEAAMPRLASMGVEFFDSVSRVQIAQEVAAAECFAYTCDTVIPSEGFSCSQMEAAAARACPITTNVDAFPEIYGGTLPMVDLPLSKNAPKFRELVIRALTDSAFRDDVNTKARALAEKFTWKKATERMLEVLEYYLAQKRAAAE